MSLTDHEKFVADAVMPAVNLNGNSRESLVKEWTGFVLAVENLKQCFPYDSFHSRNHYIKENNESHTGRDVLMQNMGTLQKIGEEIVERLSNENYT